MQKYVTFSDFSGTQLDDKQVVRFSVYVTHERDAAGDSDAVYENVEISPEEASRLLNDMFGKPTIKFLNQEGILKTIRERKKRSLTKNP